LVWLIAAAASVAALPAAAGPTFNGGPILSNPQDVYYIYYGNNWTSSEKTLTQQLIGDLSGSTYFNINSTYGSATTSLTFSGSASVTSSSGAAWLGSTLEARGSAGDTTMLGIVNKAIADGLANDANGIYYVLTSDDVLVKGFNSVSVDFCGWHSSTKSNTNTLGRQFGFIGEPSGISIGGSGCQDSLQTPGLGDFGVDAMDSVIAHELSETVTDPTGTAWWDSNSASSTYKNENADMCAWKFGSTYNVAGGNANVNLNGHDYLLQENWINTGNGTGSCALSYGRASIDVPEPESFFLLGISLACLGLGRRRKPVPA
jgi:hypothetical protein